MFHCKRITSAPLSLAPGFSTCLLLTCSAPVQEELRDANKASCRSTGKANEDRYTTRALHTAFSLYVHENIRKFT